MMQWLALLDIFHRDAFSNDRATSVRIVCNSADIHVSASCPF